MANRIEGTVELPGTVTFSGTVYFPAETVTNTGFSTSSSHRLAASKVIHRVDLEYNQINGTDVVSETRVLRICKGAGTFKGVKVRPTTAPTGGDKAFTVDVQTAADASGSWTSILTAVVTVNSSSANNTLQNGTLNGTPVTIADKAIRIVVTASGSTGSQGQGVAVSIHYEEAPE